MFLMAVPVFGQKKIKNQVVDAGCVMCKFDKKSDKGCAMAVKLNGKVYNVEGVDEKKFGEAHAHDGYCMVMKKAMVSGEIRNGKFYAKEFAYVKNRK